MGRGRGWERWGRAGPPPTQGPGTHLFHLLGREGNRVRGGPGVATAAPQTHPEFPEAAAQGRAGAEPAPHCEGGQGPQDTAARRTEWARDTRSRATREAELTEKRERVGIGIKEAVWRRGRRAWPEKAGNRG